MAARPACRRLSGGRVGRPGRPPALKTVRSEFGLDPGFDERFAREIAGSDRVFGPVDAHARDAGAAEVSDSPTPGQQLTAPNLV
ncbi:hypothetical protein ACWGJB_28475 [Streptomyces sp. NPDC054813]